MFQKYSQAVERSELTSISFFFRAIRLFLLFFLFFHFPKAVLLSLALAVIKLVNAAAAAAAAAALAKQGRNNQQHATTYYVVIDM